VRYVYIVDKHGKPLMPTTRFGRVRKLLKEGKAVAINNSPFTIRLKYESTHYTQGVYEGMDTGRENIGDAVSLENGRNVYLADVRTNNKSIKKAMSDRADHRRGRRRHHRQNKQRRANHDGTAIQNGDDDTVRTTHTCKSVKISYPTADKPVTHKVTRGKEGKFANRKRPDGWLTPSARQVIQITMNEIRQTAKMLPVTHISLERVSFDFQKLENQNIKAWEYGKGPLYGFDSYKDYIDEEQHGKCACCGGPIEEYHHIVHRADGGIDNVKNIIGLCHDCHTAIHNSDDEEARLLELKEGVRQKYYVGLLNSVIPALIEEVSAYCKEHGIKFTVTDGKATAETRDRYDLKKDHCIDAYAISLAERDSITNTDISDIIYMKRRFKKKSGNKIAALNRRKYRLNGKTVAYNRHKAMDQKDPSLEEYISKYAETHTEAECRKHIHELEIVPAKRTYTYHKDKIRPVAHAGDIIRYEKRNKIRGNIKRMTFVATSVEMCGEGHIKYGDGNKSRKIKFCRPIGSGCLQCVGTEPTAEHLAKAEAEALKHKKRSA
jgi:hypothetical protein